VHQVETLALNLLDENAEDFALSAFVLRHKDATRTILAFFGYGDALQ
jgi:hypothetical protein